MKVKNIEEARLEELRRHGMKFGGLKHVVDIGIEWQEATGQILRHFEKTQEAGLAKMADVAKRKEEREILRKRGLIHDKTQGNEKKTRPDTERTCENGAMG